jgi:serine protease
MKRTLMSFMAMTLCALALSQATAVAYASTLDNPIDDTSFYVEQLYLDVLSRPSDPGGFGDWTNYINQCGTDASCLDQHRITTARGFIESPEFLSGNQTLREGPVGSVPYNQEYVRQLYRRLLQREPEGNPDMFDNPWFVYITTNPGNYDTLVGGFINSTEYRHRFE